MEMGAEHGIEPPDSTVSPPCGADKGSRSQRVTPATVLLLSVTIGLTAGFLDLLSTVLQTCLIHREFYRLGHGFPWIIPAGVAALVAVPGTALALAARLLPGKMPLGLVVGLTAFLGFLDAIATLPLELWAALLLAGGLAVQTSRFACARPHVILSVARRTAPLLVGMVLILTVATSGVVAWSERRATSSLPPPPAGARNVLLIVWDTVRAANLSLHGYSRRTTPNLERLAARGMRFEHAFATSSWTLPSHASLFTGRWPHELSAGWKSPLDSAHPTLAGRLASLGYDTAGFVANLDYCGRETGLARGFAHYDDYPLGILDVFTRYVALGRRIDRVSIALVLDLLTGRQRGAARPLFPLSKEHARSASDIDRALLDWLSWQRPRKRPFFAFLNDNDAHSPYEVPDPSARPFGLRPSSWHDRLVLQQWNLLDKTKLPNRDVQLANDMYDDSIAYLDRRLGILLDELGRRGVLENTIVIVTSDHGEHLGDHHLFFHGCSLYRQLVDVPLVIVDPGGTPALRTVAEPVSLRDLPATILDLLGNDRQDAFPGRSLARFQRPDGSGVPSSSEPLLMETDKPTLLTNQGREPVAQGPMKGIVAGGMHYIRSGDGREELYALESDPEERTNAADLPDARGAIEGFRSYLRSMLRMRHPGEGWTARHLQDHSRRE